MTLLSPRSIAQFEEKELACCMSFSVSVIIIVVSLIKRVGIRHIEFIFFVLQREEKREGEKFSIILIKFFVRNHICIRDEMR